MILFLEFLIFIFAIAGVFLIAYQSIPSLLERFYHFHSKKVSEAERKLDEMFMRVERRKLFIYHTLSPLIFMVLSFVLFKQTIITVIAGLLGLSLPTVVLKYMERVRKEKINSQLINALMIVSSCLKGGLSFIQAIEVLVEEMPPPISQEFGLVLRENKMGLSLEESLRRMHERLRISDLSMAITAILVARETGGDLTKVLSRLITNIRDNTKLKENIRNLTLQGRMQGMIMTVLPFVFIAIVISFDKHHFDIMFASQQGRLLLALAIILQIIGIVLIQKFSILKI